MAWPTWKHPIRIWVGGLRKKLQSEKAASEPKIKCGNSRIIAQPQLSSLFNCLRVCDRRLLYVKSYDQSKIGVKQFTTVYHGCLGLQSGVPWLKVKTLATNSRRGVCFLRINVYGTFSIQNSHISFKVWHTSTKLHVPEASSQAEYGN
jgi:hypothetical protein